MVYPVLRLARVLLHARRGPTQRLMDECSIRFRVMPTDMDTSLHLNNGRYLTMMDLGRFELIARAGLMGELWRRKWIPVVHSSTIRHLASVDAFVAYDLKTRILGWDDRGIFIQQRFVRADGREAAVAAIKGVFTCRGSVVPPAEVAAVAGLPVESPPLPDWVGRWQASIREAHE